MAAHLYIHVPFCARRCAYCDFSIAVRRVVPEQEYLTALEAELAMRTGPQPLETVYLGGGTPSRLGRGVGQVLDAVRRHFSVAESAEVTVEANPEDVTGDSLSAWADAGVNRLSIGVQSFDDRTLAWMHRVHDGERAQRAVRAARASDIRNISLDLIFALPAELGRDWRADLDQALALQPDHVSLYGLTVEPRTQLSRLAERGAVSTASEESYESQYLEAHAALAAAGFVHYEISNFARAGRESRHNRAYWDLVPYEAAGPAAHRFDGSSRSWNVAPYVEWVRRLADGLDPEDGAERLDDEARDLESVYLGLRTSRGVDIRPDDDHITDAWVASGWATRGRTGLRLTATGWLRSDALATALTAHRSHCYV